MLERLIELLVHAKSGVFAGVILLGATGALVTATVENGVTTITITQASASPSSSASASPTSTASASPTASPSKSPSSSPSSSPSAAANVATTTTTSCADEAHAINAAVQQVDSAFSKFHHDLDKKHESTKGDAARKTLADAETLLKHIRQDAVTAIHATKTCASTDDNDKDNEDEDKDKDEDNDDHGKQESSQQNFLVVFLSNLLGRNTTTTTSASPTPTATPAATPATSPAGAATSAVQFTGSDPKAIADQAVAAMKLVVDNATSQLSTVTPSPKARSTQRVRTPEPRHHEHEEDDDD